MYKKHIALGVLLFIVYWVILPIAIITSGGYTYREPIPESLEWLGSILTWLGFVFGMISASYALIDGGGVAFCCPPKKLLRCGTYSMCRHPMYCGFITFLNGLALRYGNLGSLIFSISFSTFVVVFALSYEERKTAKKFPEYSEYRKSVPAFFPRFPKIDDRCPPLLFQLLFYVGHVISWFTWDIRFEKECDVPEEGYMVVANHVTYLDFAVVVYTLSRFVSFPISFFHYERHKWLYKLVGSFPIKRHRPDTRAIIKIISYIRKGGRIGIFPEAERSWDGRYLGSKEGFDKLAQRVPKPIIALRIEKAHLLYPRWGKKFLPGKVFVRVKCFEKIEEAEEFLKSPSVDENDVYPTYDGIERYLYRCPRCGSYHTIESSKFGFKCRECGFSMKKPTVGELWKIHDENYESLVLPFTEEAEMIDPYGRPMGKKVTVTMSEEEIRYDEGVLKREDVKSFITEGSKEVFFYDGEKMIGFKFKSGLLWSDLVEKFWKIEV